mgnify:CR=1 FL=1
MGWFVQVSASEVICHDLADLETDYDVRRYGWDFLEEIGFGWINHPERVCCVGAARVNGCVFKVYNYKDDYHASLSEEVYGVRSREVKWDGVYARGSYTD